MRDRNKLQAAQMARRLVTDEELSAFERALAKSSVQADAKGLAATTADTEKTTADAPQE